MASIRKRSWTSKGGPKTAWIVDYFDQSRTKRRKTFQTKREAVSWTTTALHELKLGTHTPSSTSTTVAKAGELWLKDCEADGLERSTILQRSQHLNLHINKHLGSIRLSELTTPAIYQFDDQLRAAGTSLAMRRKILTSVKTLLSFAQMRALVAQNVAGPVKLKRDDREAPGPLREGVNYPSLTQVNQLMATAPPRWRPLLIAAMFTGLRASELRGLRWADVDLVEEVIHVRQRADAWGTIGKPKSRAGSRDVPLASIVVNALKGWKASCPASKLDLVFPNTKGNVESIQHIYKAFWFPIRKKCELPHCGFHALRHVAASAFIAYLGWSPKRVQDVMGHASISMTFDTYGHLFGDKTTDRESMKKLEAVFAAAAA